MFEGFGPEKLMILLLIVLVLFGGKRIPEIGGSIGKGIREFKRGMKDIGESVNASDEAPAPASSRPVAELPAASSASPEVVAEPKRLLS